MIQEILDEASDQINQIDAMLDEVTQERKTVDELFFTVQKFTGLLNRLAEFEAYRLFNIVGKRFEDFLVNVRELTPQVVSDVRRFLLYFEDMISGRKPLDAQPSDVVRTLPAKGLDAGAAEEIEIRNIEVMLVMPPGAATRFVEREIQQCGYRVSTVGGTFEALPMIVRTKPDMVIVSAVMPELDGIDLAIGLSTMSATRNIPLALITSLDVDDEYLNLLPDGVPIIRKGDSFGDDLFKALDEKFLI
jgi:CheY-like chemotaxis protein